MNIQKCDVVALGELLIDFAVVSQDENHYPTLAAKAGGAPANFLATLSKYGVQTGLLAKVGDDVFGHLLVSTLKDCGVNTSGVTVDSTVFTTLAFVTIDDKGEREFSFARKPGADIALFFEDLNLKLIEDCTFFHFGSLSLTDEPVRTTTQRAIALAKDMGKLITYDPNLRPSLWANWDEAREQILWGLSQADIVKISAEETEFLWGCSPSESGEILLSQYDLKLAMITLGAGGAIICNKNGMVQVPCPNVAPIDTTGAGDIFGGAAISRILTCGKAADMLTEGEMKEIAVFSSVAASLSTEKMGAIPSIPDIADILKITASMHAT